MLAWAFFWESLLKEELYDPHGNTPEMIGGRVWCVLGGVGEGGVVGCWLETDSAIGCRVWFSGHLWYLVFPEHEVYNLHSKPIITATSAIKDKQIIMITNLASCFWFVFTACSMTILASLCAAAKQLRRGTKLSANQFF